MSDSDLDLDEHRANPDALCLYIMYDRQNCYLCTGTDAVKAAQNLADAYGLDPDKLSVSQGIVVTDKIARIADTSLGGVWFKRC